MTATTDEQDWAGYRVELPFYDKEWAAILSFLNRDWFKRLWIWQEVLLAKDAMILCGTEMISWTSVKVIAHCLYIKPFPQQHFNGKMSNSHRDLLYNLCGTSSKMTFSDLVDDTKHCLCTDHRDRIFALISMLSESEIQVEPDYEKDTFEVYRDIVTQHIKNKNDLNILTSVVYHDTVEELPSWVPDWSVPRTTAPFQGVLACSSSMCSVRFNSDMKIGVTGAIVARVATAERFPVAELSFPSYYYYDLVTELRRLAIEMKLCDIIDGNPQHLRSLCRTLCLNQFADQYYPANTDDRPTARQGEDLLKKILLSPADMNEKTLSFSKVDEVYLDMVKYYCLGRSLIITTEGNPGLAPKETKTGDLIVALLGCSSAMILRPLHSGNYVVVGEAFYDGMMIGEAFLGPLPDSFQFSFLYDTMFNIYRQAIISRDTGKLQLEDPRLVGVSLPSGWRRKDHIFEDVANLYVNETGEDNGPQDPRLSVESLRSRGVKLEEFDLV